MQQSDQVAALVKAMLDPNFYPHAPSHVDLVQTQMSFVFLAGEYVYKVKKPVNLGYLDYTTLEKRRYFCEREVELNRRLCPDTYLATLPITKAGHGINLAAPGEPVDYAVKMRHLPQDRMMNVLLGKEEVSNGMVEQVAHRLAQFHSEAETSAAISAFGEPSAIGVNTDENFTQTEKSIGRTISREKYARIKAYTRRFLEGNASHFRTRVFDGKIKDCHGDLHAAHVCFTDGICIYDCIEFNDRFRYGDVASEVAFLAMDIDHYGRADLSHQFVQSYVKFSQDLDMLRLLPFYKCYRAYVRGKVESFKLDDKYISERDKEDARFTASGYFDLASFYVRPRPALLITVGVTGTGKTTIAEAMARHTGLVVISSDVVRKQLAGVPSAEHHFDSFGTGLYSPEFSRRTYDTMIGRARDFLASGTSVILDASFIKAADRLKVKDLADEIGVDMFVLECRANEDLIRTRLSGRMNEGTVSDGREEILDPQLRTFEPVTDSSTGHRIEIDSSATLESNINEILVKMGEG